MEHYWTQTSFKQRHFTKIYLGDSKFLLSGKNLFLNLKLFWRREATPQFILKHLHKIILKNGFVLQETQCFF